MLAVASLTVMSASTVAPALPRMAEAFAETPDAVFLSKLVLTMPALVITLWAPFAGAVIDRFGRIRFLRLNLILYAIAGASGFFLSDLHQILLGRALLGLAVGAVMTCVQALAGDYFAGPARTRYVSIQSMYMSAGGVLFVALGGFLADLSWRAPFLIYLLALGSLALAIRFLDEPQGVHKVTPPPAHLPAASSVRAAPAASPPGGGTGIAADAWPLAPPRIAWASIALVYFLQFFGMAMYYMVSAQLPFHLRDIGADLSVYAGLAIAAGSGVSILSTLRYARLLRATSHLTVYACGFGTMALGFVVIGMSTSVTGVIVGASVVGLGMGLVFPNGTTWMLALADPRLRGRLAGGLTAAVFLGQFASPIIAQPFTSRFGLDHFYIGVAVALVAMASLLSLVAVRRNRALGGARA